MHNASPEQQVIQILRAQKIDIAAILPCDRFKRMLPLIEREFLTINLTREENGVGICTGCYLGGMRPVMVIQSTGLGNMLNALLSLNATYQIPLPIIASWRGIYNEAIPAQVLLGQALPGILEASNIQYTIIRNSDELDLLNNVLSDSFINWRPHVALILPSVWEGSQCQMPPEPAKMLPRTTCLELTAHIGTPVISRYQVIESLALILDNEIVVSNIGVPSKELYHIKDRPSNFYMLGSMGLVSAIGLGIAISQDRHVVVIDGDGSLLMNPNILTQIAAWSPVNLIIVAVNNGTYGSTGNQDTLTRRYIDLELMARGHGIVYTAKAHTKDELHNAYTRLIKQPGPALIDAIVIPENTPVEDIPLNPVKIKERFMSSL